jgi:hypothetical protein
VCDKVVVDFTELPKTDIERMLAGSAGKAMCGRFTRQQLSDVYEAPVRQVSILRRMSIRLAAGMVVFPLLQQPVWAQKVKPTQQRHSTTRKPVAVKPITIHGHVQDRPSGARLPWLAITLGERIMAVTDMHGNFSFELDDTFRNRTILLQIKSSDQASDYDGWFQEVSMFIGEKQRTFNAVIYHDPFLIYDQIAVVRQYRKALVDVDNPGGFRVIYTKVSFGKQLWYRVKYLFRKKHHE